MNGNEIIELSPTYCSKYKGYLHLSIIIDITGIQYGNLYVIQGFHWARGFGGSSSSHVSWESKHLLPQERDC